MNFHVNDACIRRAISKLTLKAKTGTNRFDETFFSLVDEKGTIETFTSFVEMRATVQKATNGQATIKRTELGFAIEVAPFFETETETLERLASWG